MWKLPCPYSNCLSYMTTRSLTWHLNCCKRRHLLKRVVKMAVHHNIRNIRAITYSSGISPILFPSISGKIKDSNCSIKIIVTFIYSMTKTLLRRQIIFKWISMIFVLLWHYTWARNEIMKRTHGGAADWNSSIHRRDCEEKSMMSEYLSVQLRM